MTRVACAEFAPVVGDPDGNRARAREWIARARDCGADLAVLPELASSGYVFADEAEARAAAMSAGDAVLADWARAAGDMTVVAGFCELGDDGRLYNSAVVLDGGRVRTVYRKTHLWDRERLVFRPGGERAPVVESAAGRIGVLVCYDLEFPEMPRSLALRGAELLVVPVNWPVVPRPEGERPPEVVQAMAAARTNRVFVAVCDRSGTERGQQWTRGTVVIDESGWVVAGERTPSDDGAAAEGAGPVDEGAASGGGGATGGGRLVVADLVLSRARDKTISERNDVLADRRPELYR